MDHVVVKGPGYRSEDCKAGKEAASALGRVKKVVSKNSVARSTGQGSGVHEGPAAIAERMLMTHQLFSLRTNARKLRSASPRDPNPLFPPYLPYRRSPEEPGREDDLHPHPQYGIQHPNESKLWNLDLRRNES